MVQFVSIGEVTEVNPPLPKSLSESPEQTVTFLPMAAVSESARIVAPERRLLGEVAKGYRYFEKGDILLAKITPCMENGKAAYVENIPYTVGFGSTEFHVLRPNPEIDGRYLLYMVWNPKFRSIAERNMTGTAGQRRVPTDFVKRYKVPLPPIDEQHRIADILDRADAIRRKRQEAIRLTEELLRSAFLEMFGDPIKNSRDWKVSELQAVTEQIIDCPHSTPDWASGGVICLRTSNLTRGGWNWDDTRYVSQEDYKDRTSRSEILTGDIILSREGTVGIAAIVPKGLKICMGQRLVQVRPKQSLINSHYLLRLLLWQLAPEHISQLMRGSTSQHLNVRDLRSMPVPVPPSALQEQFAKLAIKLDSCTGAMKRATNQNTELFNSLLQRAFRGEL